MGTPSLEALTAAWDAAASAREAAAVSIALSPDDLATVAAGKHVARIDAVEGRAVGAVFVDAPRDAVWIAIQDGPHRPLTSGDAKIIWIGGDEATRTLYQFVDLPWPISDRQWVSVAHVNTAVAALAGGALWERWWELADPALAPAPAPSAVWAVENHGAWWLLPVGGGTLAVFALDTDVGGSIPASVVLRFAVSGLDHSFRALADNAATMAGHYDAAHAAVHRPDGTAIGPADVAHGTP